MWPKEDYQEHMLGYLDGLRIEFEQFIPSDFQLHNLNDIYANLDFTSECLWKLIGANDAEWEEYRHPLESSCGELLSAIRELPGYSSDQISFHPIRSLMLMGVRVVRLEPEPASINFT